MNYTKYEGSINRPPIFDGINSDYWKVKMDAFLKSIDNKTWKAVIKGWKHHVITSEDGTTSLKPEVEWVDAEGIEALGNSKDLNITFNGVDKNMFRLINICSKVKDTWEILKTAHGGTEGKP